MTVERLIHGVPRVHRLRAAALLLGAGLFAGTLSAAVAAPTSPVPDAAAPATVAAATHHYTQVHAFAGADGSIPVAPLVQGSDGNFYGTTSEGGAYGHGTVFRSTRNGKITQLHSFVGGIGDGDTPRGGLIQAPDGYFYGMTTAGGLANVGTIYKISSLGDVTIMHHFGTAGPQDGAYPLGELLLASDGNFYGTTNVGGSAGAGTLFHMDFAGNFSTIWDFGLVPNDGVNPVGGLIQGADGLLYGTAGGGGRFGIGMVFSTIYAGEVVPLHHFSYGDGATPTTRLLQTSDGTLYGTTRYGGSFGAGTAYSLTLTGDLTVLHAFGGTATDGVQPNGALILAADGSFRGTTLYGGTANAGTVFKMLPNGKITLLHSFTNAVIGTYVDGAVPLAGVILSTAGELLGTTSIGGVVSDGSVFRLDGN
jgi:uncharacterized repeat protein (TIGR03803 family)